MSTSRRAANKAGASRRRQRGMTLVIALGVIAVATAATLVSLRIVSQESELQGRERHTREAFFAAEAGMAEGRMVLSKLVGKVDHFSDIFNRLGALRAGQPGFTTLGEVDEVGFPGLGQSWFELIPEARYSLLPGSGALDVNVTTPNKELRDINGKPFLSYPEQPRVFYRVFLHDDVDGDPSLLGDDNKSVWLVAVGEVRGNNGEVLTRSVVRALVYAGVLVGKKSEGCPTVTNCTGGIPPTGFGTPSSI